jgi:hypothetical protein
MSIRSVRRASTAAVTLATAAAGIVLFAGAPAQAATAPPTTTDPAAAAAGWLARQLTGGTHLRTTFGGTSYDDYGGTADAVLGMATAKVAGSTIKAATDWLAANADAYASLHDTSGVPGPYDGSVAKLALVAQVTGRDATSFGGFNLLKALQDDQCTAVGNADGSDFTKAACPGVGSARNIYSSVSESLAILVEARAGGAYAPSSDAVSYFLSLQCPNGGFTGLTSACTDNSNASVDETAYAAMALQALGNQQAALTKAVDWLLQARSKAGYWVAQGGADADTTGLATAALAAAGRDVGTSRAWLVSQQVTTGPSLGKGASRGALKYQGAFDKTSSVKATADALPGLAKDGSFATLTDAGLSSAAPVLALDAPRLKSQAHRGGTQTVTGTGFAVGEKVRAVLHSAPVAVATGTANAAGTVSLRFTVPTSATLGSHTVELVGLTSGLRSTSAEFTVSAATAGGVPAPSTGSTGATGSTGSASGCGSPGTLACTGRDGRTTRLELIVGGGLVLAGAGALWLGRRREHVQA